MGERPLRPYYYLTIGVMVVLIFICAVFSHIHFRKNLYFETLPTKQKITVILGLSDMVLSTEARYIRHLSLTDYTAAFQDTPAAFDLFPSGSFFSPPENMLSKPVGSAGRKS